MLRGRRGPQRRKASSDVAPEDVDFEDVEVDLGEDVVGLGGPPERFEAQCPGATGERPGFR